MLTHLAVAYHHYFFQLVGIDAQGHVKFHSGFHRESLRLVAQKGEFQDRVFHGAYIDGIRTVLQCHHPVVGAPYDDRHPGERTFRIHHLTLYGLSVSRGKSPEWNEGQANRSK